MFQFNNSTIENDYRFTADRFSNMTKCEDVSLSLVNSSCVNSSDEYKLDFDAINLMLIILDTFNYTVCPLGFTLNILNTIAIANSPSKLTPHSRIVISLALSDMCIILPETIRILRLENIHITKTCPCNEHPLTPHFYIVKLGFTGVYIIFLFLLKNIYCGYSLEPPQ